MKKIAVAFIILLASSVSLADQCAWVSQEQAVLAIQVISPGDKVVQFCELCPDQEAKEVKVDKLMAAPVEWGSDYWALSINGERVDLAYTFLKAGGEYANVANIVGCSAHDVSNVVPELSDFKSVR